MRMTEAKPNSSDAGPVAVVPQPLGRRKKLAVSAIYHGLRTVGRSLRIEWRDDSGVIREGSRPLIFCIWHNRLALSMVIYHDYVRRFRPRQDLAAMVSASRDGGFLAAVLERFGVRPVRGSTSRRGRQALLESTTWIEKGWHIAITPDGPRGPMYTVQEGIIGLAQVTGAPIVPISNHVRWEVRMRSWDRFQLPLPFSKVEIRFGPAIHVPRHATETEREALRIKLRETMLALTTD